MIKYFLLAVCLSFSLSSVAEAPVVDDSENYALLEEQQVVNEQPVARYDYDVGSDREEQPLAHDDSQQNITSQQNTNNASLLDKVQGLQQEIQELRGQLEVQAHDLKLLQEQQLSFYKDLDARLSNRPTTTIPPTKSATNLDIPPSPKESPATPAIIATPTVLPATSTTPANPADEQISYLAAYDFVKNKQFDNALTALQAFVVKYPNGGYTANAHYWLGELYMVKDNYQQAIEHFDIVLKNYPSSSKQGASLLKMGYALAALGQTQQARERLLEVVKKYPDTNIAQLAATKLNTLRNQ